MKSIHLLGLLWALSLILGMSLIAHIIEPAGILIDGGAFPLQARDAENHPCLAYDGIPFCYAQHGGGSQHVHPSNTSTSTFTATYRFDMDAVSTNSSVSPKLMGTNFIWPFVQFDPETDQVVDQDVEAGFAELGAANFYRFPGGHWSEWYQWYWGIGPQEERPWIAIPPARQPLPNTFGVVEFLETMQRYGSTDATFTINYFTGSYTVTQKWIEFVNGEQPLETVSESWTTNCWGGDGADKCWHYKRALTVTQAITASANTVAVSSSDVLQLGFYLDPDEFDPDAANCDEFSINGYGQNGCQDQNRYEYKKLSLNVNGEWMIVDRIAGNTLTVRRNDEISQEHPAGSTAYFWDYGGLEKAPTGYFAWLRSQPGFGGQHEPYDVRYWEVGNEPFWAIVDGDKDGVPECNYWYPCVDGKSSTDERTRLEEYIQFYNQVAELDDDMMKLGLDLRAYPDFSNLAGDFQALDCSAILQGWNRSVLDGVQKQNVDFVAPHFYVWGADANDLALATHPDRFFHYFVRLDECLENEFAAKPEIVPNEFVLLYNEENRGYGWWEGLGDEAGKWRDGLFLTSLLARFMQLESITGANYWHLVWPGFLGKIGDEVYPFADHFLDGDFSQKGPSFEAYRYLARYTFTNYFTPSVQHSLTETVEIATNGGENKTLLIDPLLVYATRSNAPNNEYSLFIINRSAKSAPISVSLNCDHCIGGSDRLTQIELRGAAYDSAHIQIDERVITSDADEVTIGPGSLTFRDTIPPLSIVILANSAPLSLDKQATPDNGLRNGDVLTYSLTLHGPGLNARLRDPLSPLVHYISNSITSAVTPTATYSPTAHAVIWEGVLPTNTVGAIRFQVTPGITGAGALSLALPIINTAWLTDTESGWSVSATAIVNGWRIYTPLILRSD
jgi:hypothetical protein